jgi:hypothetical protein
LYMPKPSRMLFMADYLTFLCCISSGEIVDKAD